MKNMFKLLAIVIVVWVVDSISANTKERESVLHVTHEIGPSKKTVDDVLVRTVSSRENESKLSEDVITGVESDRDV